MWISLVNTDSYETRLSQGAWSENVIVSEAKSITLKAGTLPKELTLYIRAQNKAKKTVSKKLSLKIETGEKLAE